MNKTKVIISAEWQKVMQKAVRWPCPVCGRSVGNNSIQCQKWVHRECSGVEGSMYKVMHEFSNQYRMHKCRYWCQCKSGVSG